MSVLNSIACRGPYISSRTRSARTRSSFHAFSPQPSPTRTRHRCSAPPEASAFGLGPLNFSRTYSRLMLSPAASSEGNTRGPRVTAAVPANGGDRTKGRGENTEAQRQRGVRGHGKQKGTETRRRGDGYRRARPSAVRACTHAQCRRRPPRHLRPAQPQAEGTHRPRWLMERKGRVGCLPADVSRA